MKYMQIKQIGLSIFIAVCSAIIAVGLYNHFVVQPYITQSNLDKVPAQFVGLMPSSSGSQPIDFRYAATASTPAVVHIKSTIKATPIVQNNRRRDPMQDFFGDEFFQYFHGQNPYQQRDQVATGSGVIISTDGYIVTNNHVVKDAQEIEVMLLNNKTYKATLIGSDADIDIALLKVEANGLPYADFADSDSVQIGEWVLAVGNPFNLSTTVTAGIVSAKGRNLNLLADASGQSNTAIESFIQTDAAVNPGNSGGALVNVNGQLVGINTAIASPTGTYAGYSFAVPSNMVRKVIADLKEFGVTQRGFLGVTIRTMDDELAKKLDFEKPMGVYIEGVGKGSAGELAGLKKDDVITTINGVPVNSSPELQEQVAKYRPGNKIEVTYLRGGKKSTALVELKNKYNTTTQIENGMDIIQSLGVEVEDLTVKEKAALGVESGVRVKELKTGKLNDFTDIKKGFIITQIDDQAVTDTKTFYEMMKTKSGKVLIEGIYPNKAMTYLYALRM
jgi:serine protease Do